MTTGLSGNIGDLMKATQSQPELEGIQILRRKARSIQRGLSVGDLENTAITSRMDKGAWTIRPMHVVRRQSKYWS